MFVVIIVVIIKISIIVLIIIIILIIMIILKVKMCTIEKSREEVRSKLVLERDKGTSRYRLELGPTKIFVCLLHIRIYFGSVLSPTTFGKRTNIQLSFHHVFVVGQAQVIFRHCLGRFTFELEII